MREVSWDEAFLLATSTFAPLGVERVAISKSVGRVTAVDLYSLCDLPAFTTSSMDGWAVSGTAPWLIVGEVATGKRSSRVLSTGECMRIGTGGVIPEGCTSVLPWEEAKEESNQIHGQSIDGANFRPAALESRTGDLLCEAGTLLKPAMVGLLAATGHDEIAVRNKPRVGIFFLGDELLHTGVPNDGSIRDALGPQLPSLIESYGTIVEVATFVVDNLTALHSAISGALSKVDVIFTTGGTADGAQDFIRPVIEKLNSELIVDCVRVRPGYHILVSKLSEGDRKIPFVALPGNPQSALAALSSFGRPLIYSLLGRRQELLKSIELTTEITTAKDFSRILPGNLNGNLFAPTGYLNSAMLRGVASAEGFALVEPGINAVGTKARWIAL